MASTIEDFSAYKTISICILAIFSLLLCLAIFIAITRGTGRHGGWVYLILVCVGHLISVAISLIFTTVRNSWSWRNNEPDSSENSMDFQQWANISYVGLGFSAAADVFVVLTMLEVVHKVTLNWSRSLKTILPFLHAFQWLSLVLRIVSFFTIQPELYLASWAINAFTFLVLSSIAISFRCSPASKHLDQTYTRINNYLLFSIPFFGAHLGYALSMAANYWTRNVGSYMGQVLGEAIAFYAMEAIAVLLWCMAALSVKKWKEKDGDRVVYHRHARESDDVVIC